MEGSIRGLNTGWGKGDGLMVSSSGRCRWEKRGGGQVLGIGTIVWRERRMERIDGVGWRRPSGGTW